MNYEIPRDPKETELFSRWNKPLPSVKVHGTPEELAEALTELRPNQWHLEGNKLVGDTPMGLLVQFIPTDYILTGTSPDGLPIFKKIV